MSAGKSTFREIRCLVVSWTGIGGRSPLSFGRSFRTGAGILENAITIRPPTCPNGPK